MTDNPWRALDDPFTEPDDWAPIPGTCSRCGQPAHLGERRWWHLGDVCPSRGRQADFLPDPPTPAPCPDCTTCDSHGDCPTCRHRYF